MGVVNAAGLPDDNPVGVPLIGWENFVAADNITSTTAATGFPATNLANPATHLAWVGGVNTGTESITVTTPNLIDYVAVAGHNWFSINAPVTLETLDSPPVVLIPQFVPVDDGPLIMRFAPQVLSGVRIRIDASGVAPPEAAVVYVGKLLVLERSIAVGSKHTPITYGRRTTVINGMSETGNFLGRIVTGSYLESKAEFEWFTPTFYRTDVDAFVESARETPFFWAWSPVEYPAEVGYVWLTNSAQPDVDPATRRVALTLEMRGVA